MRPSGVCRWLSFANLSLVWLALGAAACGRDEPKPVVAVSHAKTSATPDAATADPSKSTAEPVAPPKPTDPLAADRWYEERREGSKVAWLHVVWSSSTWKGQPSLHDQTTEVTHTVRMMMDTPDEFTTKSVTETERGLDGRLWWQKSVVVEGSSQRQTVSTATWTGAGYDVVIELNGEEEKHGVASTEPAAVDAEAFLSTRVAAKQVKAGDAFTMTLLDGKERKVRPFALTVAGSEPGPGVAGDVPCTKIVQKDPESGEETTFWLDGAGGIARLKAEALEIRRVSRAKAEERASRPAAFSITTDQVPPLERIFSAERTLVDVVLSPDADRPLPEFPTSPFSRVTGVEGDSKKGATIHAELKAYDVPDAKAAIPVTDPKFAKDLESTVLMPCGNVNVVSTAKAIVGDEKDARKAAEKLAVWVHDNLEKESSDVNETTAVEILDQRKGDCSEHAVLFVALCRAVGLPARRCTGFVCVGSAWGAHAWAEIWTGAWIGADPTTSDVGTSARYLYFGKPDDPESRPGLVSSRAAGRMRFVVRHLDEGADHVDFAGTSSWFAVDKDRRRAVHRLVGFDLRGLPPDWEVTWRGPNGGVIRGPDLLVQLYARADQGDRRIALGEVGETPSTFAGAPAVHASLDGGRQVWQVASRRRIVVVDATPRGADGAEAMKTLEKVLAPSFTPKPIAP